MTPGDLDWVVDLDRRTSTAPHWPPATYAAALNDETQNLRRHLALVAEAGGLAIGFAMASLLLDGVENACELESILVEEAVRRQGIGRLLLEQTILQAEQRGARRVLLDVRASNVAALALYRALGFVEAGRRRNYYDNPPDDAIGMQKELAAVEKPVEKGIEGGPHEC
jgi:ribosomal-protein-alanine N-acetyltransferase